MGMDYIKVKGFKSLKDVHVDLKPINIFIGANGAGKSNFLGALEFVSVIFHQNLRAFVGLNGGPERFLNYGTDEMDLEVGFKGSKSTAGYKAKLRLGDSELVIAEEVVVSNGQPLQTSRHFKTESQVSRSDIRYITFFDATSSNIPIYVKYHFNQTGKNSPFTHSSHISDDSYFLYNDAGNLASIINWMIITHEKAYRRILKTIESVIPNFSYFYLEPNENDLLRLNWKDKYSSKVHGPTELSDGSMRFIALAVLLMQPNLPEIIIIDEPELGLHPMAIAKVAGMIQGAAAQGSQVIVTTQSADLVNHFQPEDMVTVDLVDGASEFNRLNADDLSQWLDEYSVGDLWQRNIISGGQPNRFRKS